MRILYLGDSAPNSGSCRRAIAFRRLGHEVLHWNPERDLVRGRWWQMWHYRTGYRFLSSRVHAWLGARLSADEYDLAWVDGGAVLGPAAIKQLRANAGIVVNYHNDDPTGPRDWCRFHTLRQAVPSYDHIVTVREPTRRELVALGARSVSKVFMSYDDELLRPEPLTKVEEEQWASGVLFVGTWMPERGPFLAALVRAGVPLTIHGDRWRRAPEWEVLKSAVRGTAIYGRDYVRAIQGAKLCLGLLSKGNRDAHTIRSSEIPYIGSLFCAERTSEHLAMYAEGREAVFWDDAIECARECLRLLRVPEERARIAAAGRARVLALRISHVEMLEQLLASEIACS